MAFHCDECNYTFASKQSLDRHNLKFHTAVELVDTEKHIFGSSSEDDGNKSDTSHHSDNESNISEKAIIADTMKLLGNSVYGSLIMNKEKHQEVSFVERVYIFH